MVEELGRFKLGVQDGRPARSSADDRWLGRDTVMLQWCEWASSIATTDIYWARSGCLETS